MSAGRATAIFGGTFNPVHFGHLRSALELVDHLSLEELRFVPARLPPHRDEPTVSADHRAAMLELAIGGEPRFVCDRRELERDGPSYTVLTLESLREELGPQAPLLMVMGCDALLGLESWYRWEELSDLANLLVIARPGWSLPTTGSLAAYVRARVALPATLFTAPAGLITSLELRPQDVSATAIRGLLQSGQSARYLLPESVLAYIQDHGLYGPADLEPVQAPKE